jgi:LysM repeat protein
MPDQRNDSKRVSFSEEDAVFCVVIKPEPSGGSFYLQALDVSKNGIKLRTDADPDHPCSIWQTLFLSEIVGTRKLKFAEPIELEVKWRKDEVDQCVFGCQLRHASPESRKQYLHFVRSEMKFGGVKDLSQVRPVSPVIDNEKEEDEMAGWKSRIKSSSTPEQTRSRPWALVAIFALLAIVLVSVLYTCSQNRTLANRMEQVEERSLMAPEPTTSLDQVQTQLDAAAESLAVLKQLAQENRNTIQALGGKVQALEEKMVQMEARFVQRAPAPAREKPTPASSKPKEPAPQAKSAGSFHVVEKGENLFRISVKYNVSLDRLAEINDMKVNDPIYPGQKIKIP